MSSLASGLGMDWGNVLGGGIGAGLLGALRGVPLIGDIIGASMQYGIPLEIARQQQEATDAANAKNEARYGQALGELKTLRGSGGGQLATLIQNLMGQQGAMAGDLTSNLAKLQSSLGDTLGKNAILDAGIFKGLSQETKDQLMKNMEANTQQFNAYAQPVISGYQNLRKDLLDLNQRQGIQERQDLGTRYDQLASQTQADLARRGLTGVASRGALADVERARSGAAGTLEDTLARRTSDLQRSTMGNLLGAQERLGGAGLALDASGRDQLAEIGRQMGMTGFGIGQANRQMGFELQKQLGLGGLDLQQQLANQQLSMAQQLGMLPIQYQQQTTMPIVNTILGRSDVAPDQNAYAQLLQQLGGASAPQMSTPSLAEQLIGPGVGAFGNIISAMMLA